MARLLPLVSGLHTAGSALALGLALGAAPAEAQEGQTRQASQTQPNGQSRQTPQALTAPDVLALMRSVALRPADALPTLGAWLPRLPPASDEQVALLYLLGSAQMSTGQALLFQATLVRLENLNLQGLSAPHALAVARCLRGEQLLRQGATSQADGWLSQALENWLPVSASLLPVRVRCLTSQALVKAQRRQFVQALPFHQEAIRLAATMPAWQRSLLYSSLAHTLLQAGQWAYASDVNTQAQQLAEQAADPLALSAATGVEASLYASAEHRDALRAHQAFHESLKQARLAGSVADEALALGRLADEHLSQREYAKAYQAAQQALALATRSQYAALEQQARLYSGLALMGLHRREESFKLLDAVAAQLRAAGNLEALAEAWRSQARLLEQVGEPARALRAYRAEQALALEVALQDQQAQVLTLQEQFEAAQREADKRQLTETRALHNEALRQSRLQARLWSLSVLLGLLLLPVLWLWYARTRAAQRALKLSTERLRRQSQTDALTGLPNRHHWHERVSGQPLAVGVLYLIDLDHFKQINDEHGHAAGDEVLIEVAQRLRTVLREQDWVVRWGGEEFLVLMPHGGPELADVLALRLLSALAEPPMLTQAGALAVTASVGYAVFASPPECLAVPWESAIELVDALMYRAKLHGRNRACGFPSLPVADVPDVPALAACVQALALDAQALPLPVTELCGPLPPPEGLR